jgi:uncharacterized protein YjbJ (UPF0337 family)
LARLLEPNLPYRVYTLVTFTTEKENAMNWDQVKGQWKITKGKAREQWGDLTDDELEHVAGEQEQLEGLIQKRYGKTKEDAKEEV